MLNDEERDREVARLMLCRKQIKKAKYDLYFWSEELRISVEKLSQDRQFNFDELLTQENEQ